MEGIYITIQFLDMKASSTLGKLGSDFSLASKYRICSDIVETKVFRESIQFCPWFGYASICLKTLKVDIPRPVIIEGVDGIFRVFFDS